ncbi:hypothetical protein LR013_01590, partial [candidate division NPL-UPA2 bacterium]|nr:hypothetical protein [candidate division NPL-UPA2 bacterium]
KGKMFLENFELWQIGVLALGIGGLEQGILKLGFGKNRGFGEVNIKVEGANFLFAFPVPEDRIWGVGKFLNTESVREYEFALDNEIALRDICPVRQEKEFLGIRRVYDEQSWKRISNLCLEQLKKRLK